MTSRRNKMLSKLMLSATGETEETLIKLTIERICADMCDFYEKILQVRGARSTCIQARRLGERKHVLSPCRLANYSVRG